MSDSTLDPTRSRMGNAAAERIRARGGQLDSVTTDDTFFGAGAGIVLDRLPHDAEDPEDGDFPPEWVR